MNIQWPRLLRACIAAAIAGYFVAWYNAAEAETFEFEPADCQVSWDQTALWVACDYHRDDLVAPDSDDIWDRTSVEVYAGTEPRPWKWFCDLSGARRDQHASTSGMVYPAESVHCTAAGKRIETGIAWKALGATPEPGTEVRYGIKVNAQSLFGGKLPGGKHPGGLKNNPATFATLTLTEQNRRGEHVTPPDKPDLDETSLALTWNPQSDADWWWVYIERDGQDLPRVKVTVNEYPLDSVLRAGADYFTFRVSAEAEDLGESVLSDSHSAWIVLAERDAACPEVPACPDPIECPEAPECPAPVECPECPQCPEVPPPAECPPIEACSEVPECPDGVAPQIQQITVKCTP